jgi:general secretion pathway protein G
MTRHTLQRDSSRQRRGFSLIEVLLVLSILGVIAGLAVPRLMGRQKYANVDATRLTINGVDQALKLYAIDHLGEFPTTQVGLESLVRAPASAAPHWRGPYLETLPKDAWGRPLTYAQPGKLNPQGYDIVSGGPDGLLGTADDISNALVLESR